ncbi:MAG: DUF3365 domain-containing protein [Deltaproteobacteria bacterium]
MRILINFFFFIGLLIFVSCKSEANKSDANALIPEPKWEDYKGEYTKKADYFVQDAALALKTKLTEAMKKGGVENAINVCNEVAQKMMDSISAQNGVQIKRTALNFRNQKNAPDKYDIEMLNNFIKLKSEGRELVSDGIELENRQVKLYVPILTQKLCLECHGTPVQDIKPEVSKLIAKLYPADKATGFKEGDLRGAWVIQMEK